MTEDTQGPVEVFSTGSYAQAVIAKSLLESSGIICGMLDANSNNTAGYDSGAIAIRLVVPQQQAEEAIRILQESGEENMEGSAPTCPNCARKFAPGEESADACPGCGYALDFLRGENLPPEVAEFCPDALSFCDKCYMPSIKGSGPCPDCGGKLSPLKPGTRLCPERLHAVPPEKLSDTEMICPGCRRLWVRR